MRDKITVYTVSSGDATPDYAETNVVSTFLSRGDAIRNCAEYVLDRLELRDDIRYALMHNENDKGLRELMHKDTGVSYEDIDRIFAFAQRAEGPLADCVFNELDKIPAEVYIWLRSYLVDEIGDDGAYRIYCDDKDGVLGGPMWFNFDVTENCISDKIDQWTCVTSGTDDNDDPDFEFEEPFPEVFPTYGDAAACALNQIDDIVVEGYAKDEGLSPFNANINAAKELAVNGWFEIELKNNRKRRWDIWYTPMCTEDRTVGTSRKDT